uniref:Uncharacterized protein n=1 Tax=Plectus sambesii TaxID=2011161 RepID=A0A914X822_9BILA
MRSQRHGHSGDEFMGAPLADMVDPRSGHLLLRAGNRDDLRVAAIRVRRAAAIQPFQIRAASSWNDCIVYYMELRTYLNPALTGSNSTVHLGKMTINVQTSVTPPPTPQRDSNDGEMPMEQSDDFLQ